MTLKPTKSQVATARQAVEWYLSTHYGHPGDIGMLGMFCSRDAVGHFAVDQAAVEAGDDDALFRLFVTVAMFQRLRDALVMNILRGIGPEDAAELTTVDSLARLAQSSSCSHARTNHSLLGACDLTKNREKQGSCTVAPEVRCHLKRHTVLLRRYGHFGKVPSSAALTIMAEGGTMSALRDRVMGASADPTERAMGLSAVLSQVWRVSEKISSMFLSLVTAPDMGLATPPWQAGIDWTWYVVVDGNVDLFLASVGYSGSGTYDARREFVRSLAERIDLQTLRPGLPSFHPRLIQQALYLFMSTSNRRLLSRDCCHLGPAACRACPTSLRSRCGARRNASV